MTDHVTLKQNLPTKVDGQRLIAYNIQAEEAVLSVAGERSMVRADALVPVGAATYRVVEVVPHSEEREARRPNGWLTLRREAGA